MYKFKKMKKKMMESKSMDSLNSWKTKVMQEFKNIQCPLLLSGKRKWMILKNQWIKYKAIKMRKIIKKKKL